MRATTTSNNPPMDATRHAPLENALSDMFLLLSCTPSENKKAESTSCSILHAWWARHQRPTAAPGSLIVNPQYITPVPTCQYAGEDFARLSISPLHGLDLVISRSEQYLLNRPG
jgi:hypothetical protein